MCANCETPEEDAICPRTIDTFAEYSDADILTLAGLDEHMNTWLIGHAENMRHQEFKDKRNPVVLH